MKKNATAEATHNPEESTRTRLSLFGKLLKGAREKSCISSQQEAARLLTEAGHPISQSLIAQLETGRISNPDAATLKKLSEVYGVPYAGLVRGLVLDKYGVDDERTSQLCEELIHNEGSASVEEAPIKEHLMRSKLEFFKHVNVLDVEGMAAWQRTFPGLKDYWVIAPDFVDDKVETIRDAVIHNLDRNVNITYFVREGEEKPGGRFYRFKRRLQSISSKAEKIRPVPVPADDLRWLVADVVVANPDTDGQVGYLVKRSDGTPAFGERMSSSDVAKTVDLILPYAMEKGGDNVISMPAFRKKA